MSAHSIFTIPSKKEDEASKATGRNTQELLNCSYLKSYKQKLEVGMQLSIVLKGGGIA